MWLPWLVEGAAEWPSQQEQWAQDTRELVTQLGARLGEVSVDEWRAGMDAIANERGKQ